MRVRILTAWAGSPPCGTVADLPDALAQAQIHAGNAEVVAGLAAVVRQVVPETTMAAPAETTTKLKKGRVR